MEIKGGAEEDGSSAYIPASSGSTSFPYQAFHAGLLGNRQSVDPSEITSNPFETVETELMRIREMEKRKIKEGIIREELMRRRELEEEVIREMMIERDISMRRGGGGLPLVDSLWRPEVQRGSVFSTRDGLGLGFGIGKGNGLEGGSDGRLSLASRNEGGVLGGFPFQRQPREESVVAAKPIIDLGRVLSSVKPPDSSVTGTKRKFEASITEDADDTPSVSLSKKSRKELHCALCQLVVPCEVSMKAHLNGKKHKAKEKELPETRKTNTDNSEPLTEDTENSSRMMPSLENSNEVEDVVKPSNSSVAGTKRKFEALITEEEDDTPTVSLSKKSHKELFCDLCQVAVPCKVSMKAHLKGKKHKAKEKELPKTSKTVSYNTDDSEPLTEETENSKGMMPNLENSNEVEDVDDKDHLKMTNGSAEVGKDQFTMELNSDIKFRCNMSNFGADSVKPSNSSVAGTKRKFEAPITEDEDDTPTVSLSKKSRKELYCDLCQVAVPCKVSMKAHLHGKKHKAKEVALSKTNKTVSHNTNNSKPLTEETENSKDEEDVDHKDGLKKTNDSGEVSEEDQVTMKQNSDFKCWCSMCNFGTDSEELMTDHRMGEKHMCLMQKNGGCLIVMKCIAKTEDTTDGGEEELLGRVEEANIEGDDGKEDEAGGYLVTVCVEEAATKEDNGKEDEAGGDLVTVCVEEADTEGDNGKEDEAGGDLVTVGVNEIE